MPYDAKSELKKVKEFYAQDPMQKRFSALVTGETNAGKTFLLRTARFPIHIDSFDPGGSKCLKPWIDKGDIVVDTSFETEDPFDPKVYAAWKQTTERRLALNYYDQFGTYCLDSLTTLANAAMGYGMAKSNRAGEVPQRNKDYNPQKVEIENQVHRLMNLRCDFILTAHLERLAKLKSIDKQTGIRYEEIEYRLLITGKAVITVPLLFDELYVLVGKGTPPRREMYTDSLGEYIARSRLKSEGKVEAIEKPDIKALLKKIGLDWQDKPKLES